MTRAESTALPLDEQLEHLRQRLARLEAAGALASSDAGLQRERQLTAAVLRAAKTPLLVLDAQGRILQFNLACQQMSGCESAEVVGRPVWDVLPTDAANPAAREAWEALLCGAMPAREIVWLTKDGQRQRVCWSATLVRAADGSIEQLVAAGAEVGARPSGEDAARMEEQRTNSLLRLTQKAADVSENDLVELVLEEAVRLTRSRGGCLEFLDAEQQVIERYVCSEATGRAAAVGVSEPWPAVLVAAAATAVERRGPCLSNEVAAGAPPESATRYAFIPVLDGGQAVLLLGVFGKPVDYECSDVRQLLLTGDHLWKIVRRKRSEKLLRESEERYRTLVETSPDAILLTDAQGRLLAANRQFLAMAGYGALRDLQRSGMTAFDLLTPQEVPRARLNVERTLREGAVRDAEYQARRRDGSTFTAEISTAVVLDAHGRPTALMALIRDITARKRLEHELREHVRAMEEEDRHKDEFLAMLAHELRNPLAPISSAVDILSLADAPPARVRQAHDILRRQLEHLVRLVDDLLDVSRITRGKVKLQRESLDLAAVVVQAVDVSRPLLEARHHHLHVSVPPFSVPVWGDRVRLTQIFANLLNNAAKYTPDSGEIWLSMELCGDQAVISIRDTGVGISAEALPRVFNLFVQAHSSLDRSDGGLGLGLTLVRHLVELHGGTVLAASEGVDRGSEFTVRLPTVQHAATGPAAAGPPPMPFTTHAARVLIVDDNIDAATLLGILLSESGYQIEVAGDGPEALEKVCRFKPHAVLLDIGLPGMDGYEVARRLRQTPQTQDLLIVGVSGYGHADARRQSHAAGFNHHLIKPVNPNRLLKLLATGLQACRSESAAQSLPASTPAG